VAVMLFSRVWGREKVIEESSVQPLTNSTVEVIDSMIFFIWTGGKAPLMYTGASGTPGGWGCLSRDSPRQSQHFDAEEQLRFFKCWS
jgi:hypothetical protein